VSKSAKKHTNRGTNSLQQKNGRNMFMRTALCEYTQKNKLYQQISYFNFLFAACLISSHSDIVVSLQGKILFEHLVHFNSSFIFAQN
jgi:hypothetical protein